MAKVVSDVLVKSGYSVNFFRFNGTSFSYMDIINVANKFESDGYIMRLMMVDYLLKCAENHSYNNLDSKCRYIFFC